MASTPTLLQVKVKPNSRLSNLTQLENGTWLAQVKSAPLQGEANQELIAVVAAHFRCGKSSVSIKSGTSSRMKLVLIEV